MTDQDNHKVLKCNNMDDTQLILTALSQVPDLVEAARPYKDVNDKATRLPTVYTICVPANCSWDSSSTRTNP